MLIISPSPLYFSERDPNFRLRANLRRTVALRLVRIKKWRNICMFASPCSRCVRTLTVRKHNMGSGTQLCELMRHLLQEAGDVLPAAAWPPGQRSAVQELWRHDERSFPNGFTVITVAIMLHPKAVSIESKSHTDGGGGRGGAQVKTGRETAESCALCTQGEAGQQQRGNTVVPYNWQTVTTIICRTERTTVLHYVQLADMF